MVAKPVVTAVTKPVVEPTVATDVLLLVHVPPEVAELKVVDSPISIVPKPVIVAGLAFMVIMVVAYAVPQIPVTA